MAANPEYVHDWAGNPENQPVKRLEIGRGWRANFELQWSENIGKAGAPVYRHVYHNLVSGEFFEVVHPDKRKAKP